MATASSSSSDSALPAATSASVVYLVYASVYSCGALFLVPGLVAARRLLRTWGRDPTAVRLYGLLALGSSLRAAAFVLVALWMLELFHSHASGLLDRDAAHLHLSYLQLVSLWQLLGASASLVLASVFLLVFNTWAAMVDQVQGRAAAHSRSSKRHRDTDALLQSLHTRGAPDLDDRRDSATAVSALKPPPPPRLLFIRLMVAVYLLQMGMFLFARQQPASKIRCSLLLVATLLLVCCWAACVVLLPAYGEKMCVLLDKAAEDVSHRKRNIRRIAFIAAVFCLMHTVSLLLLAASQCTPPSDEASSSVVANTTHITDVHWPHIPLHDVVQANPAFFFPSGTAADGAAHTNDGLLRWVVMVEVLEFPTEWAMLMALLCVLPARSALPAFRGYRPIPERKSWQP
ncbi:hypothetical protein PF005_g2618 [Phytophthora fragariae]|uniref:Uncharacterized protein n=1 Tax=Phytophthora fragariae TaxID=53985 RepID=A0A6A3FTY9_9STRA|nr:hypothetical protein PF003_g17367 [Phytophthora fragariae]KAE8947570.1 hypothetical protein PF009_g2835 [Phytophthora fragariae]KAE9024280.1 hypothetical protein PF011_g3576 [Phytophthora fragariae]KAE9124440.1 hypothetical protein PF007_g6720 [Phytophthora fragariae]KAE9153759.1 hypothetical protein PF006_g2136 [Phytophthora fragariae]